MINLSELEKADPELANAMKSELARQRESVELIASENFVSLPVMEAAGSWLTNKYAEGYPGRRYYGGNQFIDVSEKLAIDRAKKLFNAEHANVQPHSGSQANMAAYFALMNPGDKILGMDLAHGGHLTHGSKVNFSGKLYKFIAYGVDKKTGMLDMDSVRQMALEHKPRVLLAGYSAYPRNIDFRAFRKIADEVGAYLMADVAHFAGIIAARKHTMPFPHCDVVTTTTHKTLRGPRGALILSAEEDRLKQKYYQGTKKNLARRIDSAVFPGTQGGPLEHVIAAKAAAFKEALEPGFKDYINRVLENASALADALMDEGFKLVSNGTDNHLILIDLTNKGVTGKQAEEALEKAGITCNKNMVPFDSRSPFDPSGIRLGTPAITTRGFVKSEMKLIASAISSAVDNVADTARLKNVRKEMAELCKKHPIYPGLGKE